MYILAVFAILILQKRKTYVRERMIYMSAADQALKHLIIEQVETTTDTDLLDLILKLLIHEAA